MANRHTYRRRRGDDSSLYPFLARTAMRRRQKHRVRLMWLLGGAVLCAAAALFLRETVFHGGQPRAPEAVEAAATPAPTHVTVTVRAATADALAGTDAADESARSSPEPQASPEAGETAELLPQYQALYAQNSDLVGWLKIDGTVIDYPVVQADDNSYYLRRGFDRLYSTAGTLFLDARCALPGPDSAGTANALIYGHNTASGTMFGELDSYADEAFYQAHPTFTFDTIYETGTWQVAAAIRTELGADDLPYYAFFDADSPEDWQQRVDAILALSLYSTGVTPQYGDRLLTLSTCGEANATTTSRFAVLAVKIH